MRMARRARSLSSGLLLTALLHCLAAAAGAQEVTFRRALELALAHSGTMAIASADEMRARQSFLEVRNQYVPQMAVGSGLAATYGFPLSIEGSAPSIIDFNAQSILINPAQRQYLRAARSEMNATNSLTRERRSQVILETALAYDELDSANSRLSVLQQEQEAAARAEQIVNDRVREGVDSAVDLTRAKLASAKVRVKIAESQGDADLLRERLAQLTRLPEASIKTLTESIPKLPAVNQEVDLISQALKNSPTVKMADEQAAAKAFRAKGEHRVNYPAVDFVAQYGLFSKSNNYQDFYKKFVRNNVTVGVAIRFPFFNLSGSNHASASDAEATIAKQQAQDVKDQVSSQTLRLQRSVRELAAAKEVAKLEYQLAQADVETAQARVQAGNASIKEQEVAQVNAQASYLEYLQSSFVLDKAQMELLRATGDIEQWALPGGPNGSN